MADIDTSKKIILRRGPAVDLPGRPIKIQPREWSKPLEEGEVAFATDQGRFFIGNNTDAALRQSNRLAYPYQNTEIIAENSTDAFTDLHGERLRAGDGHDYHTAAMVQGGWRNLYLDGDAGRAFTINLASRDSVNAMIDYAVNDPTGNIIRQGKQQLQYFFNPTPLTGQAASDASPQFTDEAEVVRVVEVDPIGNPNYDPGAIVGLLSFRFIFVATPGNPHLRYQYRNTLAPRLWVRWRMSRAR